jgi:predicted subunit of tRNA(5-methylaminomethyl-2-thiouridylate) methyltransferase
MIIPCTGCVITFIKQIKSETEIPLMIKSDPAVLDAKIILDNGIPFFGSEYYIRIFFNDGSIIEVNRVNDYGKGKRMEILYVNGYLPSIVNKNDNRSIALEQYLKFFSALIGVELKTIMDIVKNYHAICSEVENWINLSDYEQDNEYPWQLVERMLAENLFPDSIITFDGQEYFVYKWASEIERK